MYFELCKISPFYTISNIVILTSTNILQISNWRTAFQYLWFAAARSVSESAIHSEVWNVIHYSLYAIIISYMHILKLWRHIKNPIVGGCVFTRRTVVQNFILIQLEMTEPSKADVRHATKLSNFVAQLCCATKLPVWLSKLPNFWQVAQLNCSIETVSILRQFVALSLSCDWSIVCLYMWILLILLQSINVWLVIHII